MYIYIYIYIYWVLCHIRSSHFGSSRPSRRHSSRHDTPLPLKKFPPCAVTEVHGRESTQKILCSACTQADYRGSWLLSGPETTTSSRRLSRRVRLLISLPFCVASTTAPTPLSPKTNREKCQGLKRPSRYQVPGNQFPLKGQVPGTRYGVPSCGLSATYA